MAAKIKILHAATAASTPPTLEEGQLAVNALADPVELWTGVPTSRDPSGRINLLGDGAAMLVINAVAPTNPAIGTLWFDSVGLQMYIYFDDGTSSQWVPVISQPR